MKHVSRFAFALCGLLAAGSTAQAAPIVLTGTVLDFGNADYHAIAQQLGYVPPSGDNTIYSLVAFDLGSLTFDPTAVLLVDDGVPAGNALSSLAASGLDVDAAAGLTTSGDANYASGVHVYQPGERISASAGAGSATLVEAYTNSATPPARSVAAPGGTGGPGYLIGAATDALGAPDAVLSAIQSPPGSGTFVLDPNNLPRGYVAIGSGGQLSLLFASPIDRDGNIAGTPWDFVYWDTGGAGDNGFLLCDTQPIEPIVTPEPAMTLLLGAGLVSIVSRIRHRRGMGNVRS